MKTEKKCAETVTRFDQLDVFGLIGSLRLNPPRSSYNKTVHSYTHTPHRDFYEHEQRLKTFAIGKLVCASFQDGSVNSSVKFIQRRSTYSLDTS